MRTLLLESSPGAGDEAAAALTAAGHTVLRCHEAGADSFPCTEVLTPGTCPLHGPAAADVVLLARDPADTEAGLAETGMSCAIRSGTAVVVMAGEGGTNPFDGYAPTADGNVVEACGEAIRAARAAEAVPLVEEARRFLAVAGTEATEVAVEVTRTGDRCRILISVTGATGLNADALATHVHSHFRDAGVSAPKVDVAVQSLP